MQRISNSLDKTSSKGKIKLGSNYAQPIMPIKTIIAFALSVLFYFAASPLLFAQDNLSIQGKIGDGRTKTPLPGASIALFKGRDSIFVKGISADEGGNFSFTGLSRGFYRLKVHFLGYQPRTVPLRLMESTQLGDVWLDEAAKELSEVKIEGKIPPVRQLGDTAQFNAAGYKVNADASAEDLITKMPGVTVSDGKVQAQGEEVRRVLVDNKPFFGDDPNTALKTIPAEVIDKIQVFDQASDQSRFTGFNDGNTTKTINIITKAGMRNGTFGRAYVGGGTDERYKAGFTLNRFSGPKRLTLLGQANNINEQNFSSADLAGVMSSGSSGGRRGGSGAMGRAMGMNVGRGGFNQPGQDFLVNNKRGVVETQALGLNYSDNLGKKGEVTGNYFFNRSVNNVIQSTVRNFVLARDSGQSYTETNKGTTENLNHRANLRLEYNFDSSNSILYTPRLTFQDVKSATNILGNNALGGEAVNATANIFDSRQQTYNMNHEVLLRHKFEKRGRTISLNSNYGTNGSTGNANQNSENKFFGTKSRSDTLRQDIDLNKNGWSLQNNLTYTEPVGKNGQISLTYSLNLAETSSERLTYKKSNDNLGPRLLNPSLSNKFYSETPYQYAGVGYAYNTQKSNINLTINAQESKLINRSSYPQSQSITRSFQNILPTFIWRYNFTEKKSIRLFYRTSANAPTIDQLQNVVNNTNPLQLSAGNERLRQDYSHSVFFRYMSTRESDNSTFFGLVSGSTTRHYIGNSTTLALKDTNLAGVEVPRGAQLTLPVNLDGYYSLRSFVMYSRPLSFIKSNINLNANANFIRTPGQINGQINVANSPTFGSGIGLSSNISKAIDFNLTYNVSYTSVENTLIKQQNNSYLNHIMGARVNLTFWERMVLSTDYTQTIFTGLSQGFNTNFTLLNVGMGYKFLKNKQAELRLSAFDLLNQNTNVSRSITETYLEDVRSNNLTRYFMLTFTYNLRAFKAPESDNPMMQHFGPSGIMRPGVGPPPARPQ